MQVLNLCQPIENFFRDTVAEILLVFLWTHVVKGQHGDGRPAADCHYRTGSGIASEFRW